MAGIALGVLQVAAKCPRTSLRCRSFALNDLHCGDSSGLTDGLYAHHPTSHEIDNGNFLTRGHHIFQFCNFVDLSITYIPRSPQCLVNVSKRKSPELK